MTANFKILEALLYVRGTLGIDANQIKSVFKFDTIAEAKSLLNNFKEEYNKNSGGLVVNQFNGIYKLSTIPEVNEYVSDLVSKEQKGNLSVPALEVVGIIAYKAPITKSKINAIRGKISDHIVSSLLAKSLIEEVGISKTPGNPILYDVTNKFYDYFKIRSLHELPTLNEFSTMNFLEDDFDDENQIMDLYGSQREE